MDNKAVSSLVLQIDAILPQTQCGKCGYPGCKPYAQAIVDGDADINQCPPGGDANIHQLAKLTQHPYKPLNPANGVEQPRLLAVIDEQVCIGCTLCIQACPVDAIVGAAKQMHTVIAAECTGCELCVPPCPVDCIALVEASPPPDVSPQDLLMQQAAHARYRYEFRLLRLEWEKQERTLRLAAKAIEAKAAAAMLAASSVNAPAAIKAAQDKQALIQAALARAAAKKAAAISPSTEQPEQND